MRLLIGMDRSLSESQFLMPAALNLMPIPLLAMATMSDSDQDLVIEIYYHYRKLMYHVARKYFADKPEELDPEGDDPEEIDPGEGGTTTGWWIVKPETECKKIMHNGQIIIIRAGKAYSITGQVVML